MIDSIYTFSLHELKYYHTVCCCHPLKWSFQVFLSVMQPTSMVHLVPTMMVQYHGIIAFYMELPLRLDNLQPVQTADHAHNPTRPTFLFTCNIVKSKHWVLMYLCSGTTYCLTLLCLLWSASCWLFVIRVGKIVMCWFLADWSVVVFTVVVKVMVMMVVTAVNNLTSGYSVCFPVTSLCLGVRCQERHKSRDVIRTKYDFW